MVDMLNAIERGARWPKVTQQAKAAFLAKEFVNHHVLLKWTREDENCWEPYGSASINKLTSTLNEKGKIIYWSHEVFSDTYMTRPSENELYNFVSYKLINNDFEKTIYTDILHVLFIEKANEIPQKEIFPQNSLIF